MGQWPEVRGRLRGKSIDPIRQQDLPGPSFGRIEYSLVIHIRLLSSIQMKYNP